MQGFVRTTIALAVALSTACAGSASAPAQAPPTAAVDTAAAQEAAAQNRLDGPVEIQFEWALQERDSRFSGEGVTRVAPPDRARLDLFGPRGEGYLSAAFVEGEVRLPRGASSSPLPPTALLWSALGVFQPPDGARLVATRRAGDTLELDYAAEAEKWRYRFIEGRLRRVEWTADRGGRRTVELDGTAAHGLPGKAVYKDWPQFVELRLTLNEAVSVDGFSPDIWHIGQD